jgi:hypothetical protein
MSSKIRSFRHKWKVLGTVAALLLLGAMLPLSTASATAPLAFDAGYIKLHMNTDASYFQQFDNSDQAITGAKQTFKAGTKCNYQLMSGSPELINPAASISPSVSGTVVGYLQKDNGYGLGVNKAGKEGSGSCTQTNLTEKLTLNLDNEGTPASLAGLYVSSTDLDMEFKYNAVLKASFWLDGVQVGNDEYQCGIVTLSDCGPDSGGGDNYRVNLEAPENGANPNGLWDKVELTVTSTSPQGAVTLEGGNDAGTTDSIFNLAELLTPASCDNPIEGSGGGTHVTIHLLPNSGVCPDKGYSLSVSAREINFETQGGASSQWIVNVDDWAPEPADNPVPATTVYPPVGGEDAVWCDGTYDENDPGGTFGASMPAGGHSWCLIRQNTTIAGEVAGVQQMQVNELYLLEGDAKICRCT